MASLRVKTFHVEAGSPRVAWYDFYFEPKLPYPISFWCGALIRGMEKSSEKEEELHGKGVTMTPAANGAAEARKRRKEIIQSQRSENEVSNGVKNDEQQVPDENDAVEKAEKKPPKKRKLDGEKGSKEDNKKKTQIRYDPDVPMDKEQLAAWRREARRVRNRESAAASRQRIRNRINELEDEVGEWKTKYNQAMQRLEALQEAIKADSESAVKGV